ncbi:MAG TPA: hypothetical protein VH328_14150, partial [Burkholderiaceae bacterium]|nr:hypothetical protein [Burkholderiaceae bacterium]
MAMSSCARQGVEAMETTQSVNSAYGRIEVVFKSSARSTAWRNGAVDPWLDEGGVGRRIATE